MQNVHLAHHPELMLLLYLWCWWMIRGGRWCCCCCCCGIVVVVLIVFLLFFSTFAIVLELYVSTPLPHTEKSHTRRRARLGGKRRIKTLKTDIFHSRAGRPGRIQATDPEAPRQNCLVAQRAAKRPFGPPYLPPNGRFLRLYVSIPPPPHPL